MLTSLFSSAVIALAGLVSANPSSGFVTTSTGISLHYTEYGDASAPTMLFIHGYPMSAATWDEYMYYFTQRLGYHTVAYDRRGFGQSSAVDWGYDFDTLLGDLDTMVDGLNLDNFTLIGHSMGTGEVIRYISGPNASKANKAVLISPFSPAVTQHPGFDHGMSIEQFTNNVSIVNDVSGFLLDAAIPFFNVDYTNATAYAMAQPRILDLWRQGSMALFTTLYEAFASIGTTYLGDYLPKVQVPTLVIQGSADNVAPFAYTGNITAQLIPHAQLRAFPGASHGLYLEQPVQVQAAIVDFMNSA